MDDVNARKMLDLYGDSEPSGAPAGKPSSFDDVLKLGSQIEGGFQKIPGAPSTKPYEEKIKGEMGEQSKLINDISNFKTPQLPEFKPLPKPLDEQFSNPMDAFKSVIPVFAIFASLATRKPLQTAMTSMAASMDAFHKGEKDKFEQERQNSKEAMDYALAQNKQNMDVYNAIIAKENMDIGQKQALIKAHAKLAQDWKVLAGLNNEGYKGGVEAIKANNEIHAKATDIAAKIYKTGQTKASSLTDAEYESFKNDPKNQVLADAWASGVPVSSLVRGRGEMVEKKLDAIQRLGVERHPGEDLAQAVTGFTGKQAGARTVGANAGRIKLAANSLSQMIPIAEQAAAKVDLGNYPSLNAIENAVAKGTGDANIVKLNTALQAVISDHAALMVRGGQPTVESRNTAREMINSSLSEGQIKGYFDIVEQEKDAQMRAIKETEAGNATGGEVGATHKWNPETGTLEEIK